MNPLNQIKAFTEQAWTFAQGQILSEKFNYADANSTTSRTNALWREGCLKSIFSWASTPTSPSSAWQAISTCFKTDSTTLNLYKLAKEISLTTVKDSFKWAFSSFFTYVPPFAFPSSSLDPTKPIDYKALTYGALASFSLYTFSLTHKNDRLETIRDTSLLGTAVGTTLSWTFDQNLYLGWTCGFLSGIALGALQSYLPSLNSKIDELITLAQKAPFVKRNWGLILPTSAGIFGAVAFNTLYSEASKTSILIAGGAAFALSSVLVNQIAIPVIKETGETLYFLSQTIPSILPLAWMSASLSGMIEEMTYSHSMKSCSFENN